MRVVLVFLALILTGSLGVQTIHAQNGPGRYFPKYGQSVSGGFLFMYDSVANRDELLGEPISAAFVSPTNGRLVQYFEKVRFEDTGSGVQISDLGALVMGEKRPVPVLINSAACQVFVQTGFQVCYAFLDFFTANGGVAQFGYPISNLERRADGQLVQYFQKALLEHRPGLPAGKRIVAADLGRMAFYQLGEDTSMLAAEPRDFAIDKKDNIEDIIELKVRAYPKDAVMPRSGNQTIYVVIQDQRRWAVQGATVELLVTMPSGEPRRYLVPGVSGENGIMQYTFAYSTQSLGIAKVEVLVRLGEELVGRTVTSFRIWW